MISASESLPTARRGRWRRPLSVGLGGLYLWRAATLTAKDGDPPDYEGPVPGGILRVDFFPLALGGRGDWYEGVGLHAEGSFQRVETVVDRTAKTTVVSDVMGGSGGLSMRVVFWDSATAPDFTLKLGYSLFIFPLDKGPFPGARYTGPYAGGTFTIPFVEQFGLVLGGSYSPLLTTSGKLKRLGKKRKVKPVAMRGEGGFRLFFDPFEIMLLGRFEQFDSRFKGTTDLENSNNQYDNVKLSDRMVGGYVSMGVAF